jgi:hypothetical protein
MEALLEQLNRQFEGMEREKRVMREKLEGLSDKSALLKLSETKYSELKRDYELQKQALEMKGSQLDASKEEAAELRRRLR